MILSSDELEIVEYLKSWKGTPISLVEICRCAGGRRKFREEPNWARGLVHRLVEMQLIQVNERGHYRAIVVEEKAPPKPEPVVAAAPATKAPVANGQTVGDNYFPGAQQPGKVVGGDYFPADEAAAPKTDRWISPQMADILKKSGKKFGKKTWGDL